MVDVAQARNWHSLRVSGNEDFRRLDTLGRPVVALLTGAALGGGWELALAAHARFALDDKRIRFGTPEVTLGLIPGATGITKTVRLLGLMAARRLSESRGALTTVFAVLIFVVAAYMLWRSAGAL